MSALFAATYPERVSHLLLFGGFARDLLWKSELGTGEGLGYGSHDQMVHAQSGGESQRGYSTCEVPAVVGHSRRSQDFPLLNSQIDVRSILPTGVLQRSWSYRRADAQVTVERGRDLAAQIPVAKYIEYPDNADHAFFSGDTEALLGDIEEFVTGHRAGSSSELERVLATVLFTVSWIPCQRGRDG